MNFFMELFKNWRLPVSQKIRLLIVLFSTISIIGYWLNMLKREYYSFCYDIVLFNPFEFDRIFGALVTLLYLSNCYLFVIRKEERPFLLSLWLLISVFTTIYWISYPRIFPFFPI